MNLTQTTALKWTFYALAAAALGADVYENWTDAASPFCRL